MASHWGWDTVFDTKPTFHELLLMAQLMSEERVGHGVRRRANQSAAQEAERLQRLRMF